VSIFTLQLPFNSKGNTSAWSCWCCRCQKRAVTSPTLQQGCLPTSVFT